MTESKKMGNCFLQGYGVCQGKISGEHYISKTVLKAISPHNIVQIGGLSWQPQRTTQSIGISSLVSNILCQKHNSKLTDLDSAAGKFFNTLSCIDKAPSSLPGVTKIEGLLIERWFIKVLCGLASSGNLSKFTIPEEWKLILIGEISWPSTWGLYLPTPSTPQTLANEFYIETHVHPNTLKPLMARFRLAGVSFNLLLGNPDSPTTWGIHRPQGMIFRNPEGEKRIEFSWPIENNQAVTYTKVGATKNRPSQWSDWSDP